jgi:type IV pilus assembly protein PilM
MHSVLSRFKIARLTATRPQAAIEIAASGVLAASRAATGKAPLYAFQALPAGMVVPQISEPNLRVPGVVSDAIRSALDQVSLPSRDVTVVLPDSTTRIFILDFDTLPENASDILQLLRFRIRRVVRFDVETAQVSYQRLPNREGKYRALVVVIPGPILTEYEEVVRSAGYEPGAVLPTSLAGLAALTSSKPHLVVSVADTSVTTSILATNDILLYRTRQLSEEPALWHSDLERDIAVAAAYFEDQLMSVPKALHYAGPGGAEELAGSVNLQGLAVFDVAPKPEELLTSFPKNICFAGVTGALAGAR